jgi:hypothetical protein
MRGGDGIAARKSALPKELQDALELPPIVLPPHDPMGSLAGKMCGLCGRHALRQARSDRLWWLEDHGEQRNGEPLHDNFRERVNRMPFPEGA